MWCPKRARFELPRVLPRVLPSVLPSVLPRVLPRVSEARQLPSPGAALILPTSQRAPVSGK